MDKEDDVRKYPCKEATYQDIREAVAKIVPQDCGTVCKYIINGGCSYVSIEPCPNQYDMADQILSLQVGNLKVGVYEDGIGASGYWLIERPENPFRYTPLPTSFSERTLNDKFEAYKKGTEDTLKFMLKANYRKIREE